MPMIDDATLPEQYASDMDSHSEVCGCSEASHEQEWRRERKCGCAIVGNCVHHTAIAEIRRLREEKDYYAQAAGHSGRVLADLAAHQAVVRRLADAAEMLWVVLANAHGGDWMLAKTDWQEAAARWRNNYLDVAHDPLVMAARTEQ